MDSGQARALIGGGWDRARVQMKRQKVRPSVILVECAPGAGQDQAAGLTVCRAWWSSNWAGLR